MGAAWSEEVELASGELIVLKRTVSGVGLGELGGSGYVRTLKMTLLVKGSRTADPPQMFEAEDVIPIIFDYDAASKEWVVVATMNDCNVWRKLGSPRLPYFEYRTSRGVWRYVELSDSMIGKSANVLTDIDLGGEKPYVEKSEKMHRNKVSAERFGSVMKEWPFNVNCQ
ncbi:hypothetical protein GCM10025770_11050 [Viridibacterium curvum]|uniref:Uncharacterized protein n=1 Tax=Viridibacterium curvum TaxID=1101404 RepID=A0ABP9QGN8_9RHOO